MNKIVSSCSGEFMLYWPKDCSSRGKTASTRRPQNDLIEIEVKTATPLLWVPHASKQILLIFSYCANWNN